MSHTYNDVMKEVLRIESAKTWLNAAVGGTFGVPGMTGDSSLADLSTNIGLIDTDPHPDYDLPWIMADGSSAFVVPTPLVKDRGADVTVSLVPHPDNAGSIVMATMASGAQWGLNQMTMGMRARYRMDANPGNTPDTNNYAGQNDVWSDSSCPYWHKMRFIMSHYDDLEFLCSLYQAGSWIHARSDMVQASTSGFNSLPIAVFGSLCVYNDKVAMKPNGTNHYFASKGTMLYDITFTIGTYNSETIVKTYKPVLHWDRVYKKYRPCLYESRNRIYSSFAIGEGDNLPDDGRDGAYYIAPGLTIMGDNNPMPDSSSKTFATNIPNKAGNKLIVLGRANVYTGVIDEQKNFVSVNSADSTYNLNIYMSSGASGKLKSIKITEKSEGKNKTTDYFTVSVSNSQYFTIMYTGASNSLWYSDYGTSALSTSNGYHHHTSVTRSTLPTQDDSLRGNYTFGIHKTAKDILAIYAYIIYDSNDVLTNYIVPCLNSSNSIVLYDVITKTLYT